MTSRKPFVNFGLVVLALLSITFSLKAGNEKKSKINLLIYSGISSIPYRGDSSPGFYKVAANFGFGFSYSLSEKMFLMLSLTHYLFVPKEKYSWHMWFGSTLIELNTPFYMGDFTYEFSDFLLDFKVKHLDLGTRFNFYSITGAGASYRKEATHWSIGIYGRRIYYTKSIYILVSAGLGLEFAFKKNLAIFLEGRYNYCFWRLKEKNTGVIPVKMGLIMKF